MLDKVRLGSEIKKIRKSKNLTQKQLAFGMCSQSEISRIEAGEFFPSIDLLYLIANQLQLPINYFFEILIHEQAEQTQKMKDTIWNLSYNKKYQDLLPYIENKLKETISFYPETRKFLLWQKFMAAYYLKKLDADNCRTELLLLLRQKLPGMDILLDLHIKNSIANILAENKHFEESMKIYKSILEVRSISKEADTLKIKVIYNLGKLLYLRKDYSSSLSYTNQGIELSIEGSNMSLLGQYYYQKGSLQEEMNFSTEEISLSFQSANFFFDLLDLKLYKEILLENKALYLKEKK